jgi:2'-5' RNA ligase
MNFEKEQPRRPRVGQNRPSAPDGYGSNRNNAGAYNRGGRFNQHNNRPAPKRKFHKPSKQEKKIYFIALLPTAEAGKEIIRLKQEFAERYGARFALKVLPHITMQVPFTADPLLEKTLTAGLAEFAAGAAPFEVTLNGFGISQYKNQRILYIRVEQDEAIMNVHRELAAFLRKEFGFSRMLARDTFKPHITIAFNDLSGEQLEAAWPEYEQRPFNISFRVNNLYFLRHNGASWEVLQKCRLGQPVPPPAANRIA